MFFIEYVFSWTPGSYLFIIFIDSLIDDLISHFDPELIIEDIHALLHADDSAVLATSHDKLFEKLIAVENYLEENDLSLNFKKTVFMCIGNNTRKITQSIYLKNEVVKYTSSTIYLGTTN